jgi:hypothetical protein
MKTSRRVMAHSSTVLTLGSLALLSFAGLAQA